MDRIPVVVFGATGMVGQRLLQLLAGHEMFRVAALCASPQSAGKAYREARRWFLPGEAFAGQGDQVVLPCEVEAVERMTGGRRGIAISALGGKVARQVEKAFAEAGWLVVSNASAYRMAEDTPLIIPEVNPGHLEMLERQTTKGKIITNPNCTSIPLCVSLAPIHRRFGVKAIHLASYQAVSGAGYPGESAFDMIGNVHPHPGDEEQKVAEEPRKILGSVAGGRFEMADFRVSARCVRVPVVDGHLIAVSVATHEAVDPDSAIEAMRAYRGEIEGLPSSPSPLIHVVDQRDRPTPRQDSGAGGGMAVTVGRVEACEVQDLKYFALAHNTIRGAAGAAILNAELLVRTGWTKRVLD